jgi:hypothetical protein
MIVPVNRQFGVTTAAWSPNWMIRMKEYWFLIQTRAKSLNERSKRTPRVLRDNVVCLFAPAAIFSQLIDFARANY